jgi:RHS repeat-associated protein
MGNYEEEIFGDSFRKIHYICGGNGLAALYVQRSSGQDTLYYIHTDYQGSLIALSLPDGTVKERYAYDLWGNRRNPDNWTQADTRTAFILNRGYTMHEHLPEFNLINMNGRVYDPLVAMFLSPDPYLQAPGNWLNYNRYGYCLNNPLLYTDPSGEFLGLFLRAMSFLGGYLSNSINGVSDPAGKAWKNSGNLVNGFSSAFQVPVYKDNNTLISVGLDPLALGVSANVAHREGDNTSSLSVGFGALGGFYGNAGTSQKIGKWNVGGGIGIGNNYWGWNASAVHSSGYGLGYGQTNYGDAAGLDPSGQSNAQRVGSVTLFFNHNSFRLENDVLARNGDRWRTNAWELTFGEISFGSYIYTNYGAKDSNDTQDKSLTSPIWGANRNKEKHGVTAWKDGRVYSAPMWIGYRIGNQMSRIGYNFHGSQDLQQNGIHSRTSFGVQNYYLNYQFENRMYMSSGYYSPFSLWGY